MSETFSTANLRHHPKQETEVLKWPWYIPAYYDWNCEYRFTSVLSITSWLLASKFFFYFLFSHSKGFWKVRFLQKRWRQSAAMIWTCVLASRARCTSSVLDSIGIITANVFCCSRSFVTIFWWTEHLRVQPSFYKVESTHLVCQRVSWQRTGPWEKEQSQIYLFILQASTFLPDWQAQASEWLKMERRLSQLFSGSQEQDPDNWVEVQKTTFTNWANDKLKQEGVRIANLETDLEDGVILIKLLEALAPGKRMPGR